MKKPILDQFERTIILDEKESCLKSFLQLRIERARVLREIERQFIVSMLDFTQRIFDKLLRALKALWQSIRKN